MAPYIKDIRELLKLEPNWDSYGGLPISEKAIEHVESLHVVPLGDGAVMISTGNENLCIEIDDKGIRNVYLERAR